MWLSCVCSTTKFLEAAAEAHTWGVRSRVLATIHASFKGLSNTNSSSLSNGNSSSKPGGVANGTTTAAHTNGSAVTVKPAGTAAAAAAAAAAGVAPAMVRLNLRCSKLVVLLDRWLGAADKAGHITFLRQLLQVGTALSRVLRMLLPFPWLL
jgi:hypothetical protein